MKAVAATPMIAVASQPMTVQVREISTLAGLSYGLVTWRGHRGSENLPPFRNEVQWASL
jgi:hypothetical protein